MKKNRKLIVLSLMFIVIAFASCKNDVKKKNKEMKIKEKVVLENLIDLPEGVKITDNRIKKFCPCNNEDLLSSELFKTTQIEFNYFKREYTFDTLIDKTPHSFCFSEVFFSKGNSDTTLREFFKPYIEDLRGPKTVSHAKICYTVYNSFFEENKNRKNEVYLTIETTEFLGGGSGMYSFMKYSIPITDLEKVTRDIYIIPNKYKKYLIEEFKS